jgi:hypothetical protein
VNGIYEKLKGGREWEGVNKGRVNIERMMRKCS